MLRLSQLAYSPRGLGPIDWVMQAGQLVMLCGPSGSGKSTLGQLLCGDLEPSSGQIVWQTESSVGYLSHDAESQLLGSTVGQELEIGAPILTDPGLPGLSGARRRLIERFRGRETQDPQTLSIGEQQLLLLASLASGKFQVLILDEALSCLDGAAFSEVCRSLRILTKDGMAVLVVSHELRMVPWCDRCLGMVEGRIAFDRGLPELIWGELRGARIWLGSLIEQVNDRALVLLPLEVAAEILPEVGHGSSSSLPLLGWGEQEFPVPAGQTLAIAGESGSGKSRLLATVLGVDRLPGWGLLAAGESYRVMLPQHADCILWRRTVAAELMASSNEGRRRNRNLANLLEAESAVPDSWLQRSPRALSHGQVKYLAALCLLLQCPDVLLLDEPFSGLDSDLRMALSRRLRIYGESGGRVVMASHHPDELVLYAERLLVLDGGVPLWFDPGWQFFRQHPNTKLGRPACWDWNASLSRGARDGGQP